MNVDGLRHVALFYDDADAAVSQVVETIDRDRTDGTAVLVCLPDPLWSAVEDRVGGEGVTFLAPSSRYTRPATAMHLLWTFLDRSLAGGARRVHSIGEIAFDGSSADDDWHWYERAVNEVLADVPLTATCLFDTGRLSPATLASARTMHAEVVGHVRDIGQWPDVASVLPLSVPPPERAADLTLSDLTTPAPARRAVRQLGEALDRGVLDRAQLVVSELVTNAILHGGGRAEVRYWREGDGLVLQVGDDGPGIDDPFATLRPPALPARGAGLWTANLEASRLSIDRRNPHGTVVTARID